MLNFLSNLDKTIYLIVLLHALNSSLILYDKLLKTKNKKHIFEYFTANWTGGEFKWHYTGMTL